MDVRHPIEWTELAFEAAGVLVLVVGAIAALLSYAAALLNKRDGPNAYQQLRRGLGRAILLGLEFLVAADIIRSVALDPTFVTIGVLGLLVLVRTFLSWSLEVEIEGQWPWRRLPSRTRTSAAAGEASDQR